MRITEPTLVERARRAALAGSETWKAFARQLTPSDLEVLDPLTIATLGSIAAAADRAPAEIP